MLLAVAAGSSGYKGAVCQYSFSSEAVETFQDREKRLAVYRGPNLRLSGGQSEWWVISGVEYQGYDGVLRLTLDQGIPGISISAFRMKRGVPEGHMGDEPLTTDKLCWKTVRVPPWPFSGMASWKPIRGLQSHRLRRL
jgi:hypothetical protein